MSPKTGALVAAILGTTVASVDATAVNVALPAIARELGGGLPGQVWVTNAYLLTLAAFILIAGSLADVFGERRVFAVGVAAFGVASVLCAIAPSIGFLIGARALQGLAGALLTPASLAIIIAVFPANERGAAIGTWTAWGGIGFLVGPLLGGQLVDALSWRAVFAINVPLVLLTLELARRHVPGEGRRAPGERRPRLDVAGATLCAAGLAGPTFALIEQPRLGWGHPAIWGAAAGGLVVLALFLRREARVAEPMLPLALFRRRNFAWGNLETLFLYAGLGVFSLFLGLFLQQAAGFSALAAGATGVVPTLVMFVLSRRFGALADRLGPRRFMAAGPLLAGTGLLLLLRLDTTVDPLPDLGPALLMFSLGLAVTVAPLTTAVLADADEERAGIASGVNNAIARTASLLATAAVGAVLAANYTAHVEDRLGDRPLPAAATEQVERAKARALGVARGPAVPDDVTAVTRAAAVETFRLAMGLGAALMLAAGIAGFAGIRSSEPPRAR